jgi:hypothetical protein
VGHVFLTDICTDGLAMHRHLRKLFPAPFLTVRNEHQVPGHLKTYAWCAEELRAKYKWIVFLDTDEYLTCLASIVLLLGYLP